METNILTEKLTEHIKVADEKKVEALYTLLEDDIETDYKWYEDEAFAAELDEDVRKIESGEEKTYSIDEVKDFLQKQKAERYTSHV